MLKRQTKFSHIVAFLFVALFVVSVRAQDVVTDVATDFLTGEDGRPGTVAPTIEISVVDTIETAAIADTAIIDIDTTQNIPAPRSQSDLETMSREELFRLAFGAVPERPRSLEVRLFVDGREFGKTEIVHEADFSSFSFLSERMSRHLDTLILEESRPLAGDTLGFFTSTALKASGYEIDVNELQFELRIAAPPEHKRMQRMNLGGGYGWAPRGDRVEPAWVSFFMNYRLTNRFTHREYDYDDDFRSGRLPDESYRPPAALHLDGALTVAGTVLEGSAWINEPREGEDFTWENFRRGDIRLVRDILPWQSRITLGDVYLGSEILSGPAAGGVSYEHSGWFFGHDPRDERNSVTFFMPRSGTVELYVNDMYQDRFALPAGHHRISGFSGDVGRNRVRLVLRMEDGSIEEVPHDFVLSDPRNLPKGDLHYSVAGGLNRETAPSPAGYSYDPEAIAMSAYAQYGLHHAVSVGAAGQASGRNGAAGARVLWSAGERSNVILRTSMNFVDYARLGGRAEVSYTTDPAGAIARLQRLFTGPEGTVWQPSLSLAFRGHYQSALHETGLFDSVAREGTDVFGVSGSVGAGVFRGSVTVGGGLNYSADSLVGGRYALSGYDYSVRVSQSYKQASISLSAGENVVVGGRRNPYFSLHSNYALGFRYRRHSFTASTNLGTNSVYVPATARMIDYPDSVRYAADFDGQLYEDVDERYRYDWQWGANAGWSWSTPGHGVGEQNYNANVGISDMLTSFTPGFGAGMRHVYNRANLSAGYGYGSSDYVTYSRQSHDINASLAGSFMFADGLWAFGRPVNGGFILVDKRHSLKDATLHVDRGGAHGRSYSKTGWLGAAYKNNVMSYYPSQMNLTLTDAPLGAMLDNNLYHVVSGYKQGHALRVGTHASVLIYVRFVSADGRPVAYTHVTIEQVSGRGDFARQATFTGADGALQASGLMRGNTYRIKFGQAAGIKDVQITIPTNAELIYEMPDMKVESVGASEEAEEDAEEAGGGEDGEDEDDGWGDVGDDDGGADEWDSDLEE